MFCNACGSEIPAYATMCPKCGTAVVANPNPQTTEDIPNHLVGAILVTVFCCMPFGIVAIINAAEVNTKIKMGDLDGARRSSQKAGTWLWWGFGLGLAVSLIGALFQIAAIALANQGSY